MNKQIEEIAKSFRTAIADLLSLQTCRVLAQDFLNLGYRKASEVAREIFADIEQAIFAHGTKYAMKRLEELKKKYEVTDE